MVGPYALISLAFAEHVPTESTNLSTHLHLLILLTFRLVCRADRVSLVFQQEHTDADMTRSTSPFWRSRPSPAPRESSGSSDKIIGAAYSHTDMLKMDNLYDSRQYSICNLTGIEDRSQEAQDLEHHRLARVVNQILSSSPKRKLAQRPRHVETTIASSRTIARAGIMLQVTVTTRMVVSSLMRTKTSLACHL